MKTTIIIFLLLLIPSVLSAQEDSVSNKLSFEGDFRFRFEQDWNVRESDGSFSDDRTRLRYRFRAGMTYSDKWYSTGFRIRTGNPIKQQDPQLTLGDGFKEFGTLPIGLEKVYFQGEWTTFKFWLGKNTFPFQVNNELFWSENVFPEGVAFQKSFKLKSKFINDLNLRAGHFVMATNGQSLDLDAYFQGYQAYVKLFKNRVELFPSLYLFRNIANIPDGGETFFLDYSILHVGTRINILKKSLLDLELDFYHNFENYNQNDSISTSFKEQKSGLTVALKYGVLKHKGDWLFKATYTYLQQYSIVDFMAQNDWARWDYSSTGSPDGRLTNYNGIELVAGYRIDKRVCLKMKYYLVEQLIAYGTGKETNSRIRLDLDFAF